MSFEIGSFLKQLKAFVRLAAASSADQILVIAATGLGVKNANQILPYGVFGGFVDVTAGADVTGFTVPATAKAVKALVYIHRDATTDLNEVVTLDLINDDATWVIATNSAVGDDSAVDFAVTSSDGAGQIRYASTTKAGHSAASSYIKWQVIGQI